jgi:hypothetical protein
MSHGPNKTCPAGLSSLEITGQASRETDFGLLVNIRLEGITQKLLRDPFQDGTVYHNTMTKGQSRHVNRSQTIAELHEQAFSRFHDTRNKQWGCIKPTGHSTSRAD